ncbi:hypothetical protein Ccar_00045 [Clostridium carboxidivorans P7]|uniref:YopX protein domain-containing protein n=1 Tax=Clostridium carboxidivorans P7 TaxID=536227 RepID=C6Q1R7_9CLOT|nr:YopX family protein [Clostridium carboxidivorans]AKN29309.1 hypothetical protein Ccar_00045 [Clostridium carboxidivorans P7]EET84560.1 hypothetical protein CcarbDRAFT_4985 [Clostridium carboxidivorans P7]EFG89783.1 putative phage conserved hypothetical protein TIGR01671 [Clostridium carboxidivorans P7]
MREFKFKIWNGSTISKPFFIHDVKEYINEKCEILQYTGLKDKNGREIYEGDIIAINNEKISLKLPIKFGKYSFSKYIGECGELSDSTDLYGFYVENEYLYIQMLNGNVIIVGNIYENLELIRK